MQLHSHGANASRPGFERGAGKVAVRSSRGDGSRVFIFDAPMCGTIVGVKRLLCHPPHSLCSDASALELVLQGEGAAAARAPLFVILSTCISHDYRQLASCLTTLFYQLL